MVYGPQTYWGHDLDFSKSRDIIGFVTNRLAICYFILVSLWNGVSIFNRFRDIVTQNQRGRAHTHVCTERKTHAASDFIFRPMRCIALDRQGTV